MTVYATVSEPGLKVSFSFLGQTRRTKRTKLHEWTHPKMIQLFGAISLFTFGKYSF